MYTSLVYTAPNKMLDSYRRGRYIGSVGQATTPAHNSKGYTQMATSNSSNSPRSTKPAKAPSTRPVSTKGMVVQPPATPAPAPTTPPCTTLAPACYVCAGLAMAGHGPSMCPLCNPPAPVVVPTTPPSATPAPVVAPPTCGVCAGLGCARCAPVAVVLPTASTRAGKVGMAVGTASPKVLAILRLLHKAGGTLHRKALATQYGATKGWAAIMGSAAGPNGAGTVAGNGWCTIGHGANGVQYTLTPAGAALLGA